MTDPDSPRHAHADHLGHGHSHGHGTAGGWELWRRSRTLRLVVVGVGLAAIVTAIGVIALWPSDDGREAAIAAADDLGLVTDRVTATVVEVTDAPCSYSTEERPQTCRVFALELTDGPDAGKTVTLPEFNLRLDSTTPPVAVADHVVLGYEPSTDFYFYADRDRRSSLGWLALLFAVVVVAFARLRGLLALIAMATTVVMLVAFVGPAVLDGHDPVLVAIVAAAAIAFVSLYLTHGVNPTTTIALAGTLAALTLTFVLSALFFGLANFSGFATEEALILPLIAEDVDVAGLLLGGAVLGTLGALDDVTVTQVATVAELRRADPATTMRSLTTAGIRVGREHIASTVNTLLLAYAGASLPLILLFAVSDQSLVMIANSELIAVEIARTLCGSIGLIAAVPVTTVLAAAVLHSGHAVVPGADEAGATTSAGSPPVASWDDFAPEP